MEANLVIVSGNLTRDPELRYTPQGTAVCSLSLAVNNTYGSGEERKQDTTFIEIITWKNLAESCNQYLTKGKPIYVEGRLKQDTWENTEGQKRSKIKIVANKIQFLARKEEAKTEDAI
ncbi:single-stranded DNA-binding protein [Candidatus Pacearchaeota archaeon]|jgi:single-strand DNA-binding protein|nr:single-stranded DNA-binding protein [Candidatus Pacearchaeota archaeon]|tara:strand:+ start:7036 stop:7389 length:354 start_codon:yes stop_codon:yes gene_type:complete